MRYIKTGNPPESFERWVKDKPRHKDDNDWFQELHRPGEKEKKDKVISDLHKSLAENQSYLCAYCCCRISKDRGIRIEHVAPRSLYPERSLDYHNMVASCSTKGQCDDSHENKLLRLTPLMEECESELVFYLSGRVEGKNDRAKEMISILNLGDTESKNGSLIQKRRKFFQDVMFTYNLCVEEVKGNEIILKTLLEIISEAKNGELLHFSPALANMLRDWLSSLE